MYLLFEEPSAYSEKNSSVQPVDGGGEEAQLEVCIPISVQVFLTLNKSLQINSYIFLSKKKNIVLNKIWVPSIPMRYLVKYGIPFGAILFYGLWRQQIIRSSSKGVLFIIIAVGTSFSPILELMFFMPFLYSGLIFGKLLEY